MKMAHFISLPASIDAQELAKRFTREIWKLHGLPEEIISDRDPKFTSYFWAALMEILGVDRKLSTAFHPETDSQTEQINQTLEQYFHAFCNYNQNN